MKRTRLQRLRHRPTIPFKSSPNAHSAGPGPALFLFLFDLETRMAHAAFQWDDPFLLDQQLTDDERAIRDAANAYCQDKLAPRVLEAFRLE